MLSFVISKIIQELGTKSNFELYLRDQKINLVFPWSL